jgi:DNA-binding protein HU-beta
MKKKDLISEISKNTGIEQIAVHAVLDQFTALVKEKVADGETVVFRGFGSFLIKKRAARVARNIQKNKTIMVPAKKIAYFRPSKEFALILESK